MVNGIPGNMAVIVARHVSADERFTLVPCSLTGPEIEAAEHKVEAIPIRLLKIAEREQVIDRRSTPMLNFIANTVCLLSWVPPAEIASASKRR